MLDLSKTVGMPFKLVLEDWSLKYPQDYLILKHVKIHTVKSPSLRYFYLNPVTVLINKVYGSYWLQGRQGILEDIPFRIKLVVLNQDYVGIETTKTKSVRVTHTPRIIEGIYGKLLVIMFPEDLHTRQLAEADDQDATQVLIDFLNPGDKIVIPVGYVYLLANANPSQISVALEVHNREQPKNTLYKKFKGTPFYLVLRNASYEIVKNPQFRFVKKYKVLNKLKDKILKRFNISPKTSLLKQLTRKPSKFAWLFEASSGVELSSLWPNILD